MERILLLIEATQYSHAREAVESARSCAASPERISYGLSLFTEPDESEQTYMHALGSVQFVCPSEGGCWYDAEALWQGEGYVLIAHPAMRFTRNWDIGLLRALRQANRTSRRAALTGIPPRPQDPVDAVYAIAAEGYDSRGRLCFTRGTALRYAAAPQRSAFVHPDFCFAPATFFREVQAKQAEENVPLFLAAHSCKWDVYTLHRPLIHLAADMAMDPCGVPEDHDGSLARFEKRFGLKTAERRLSAMARQGVFTQDLTFPVRVPWTVRMQEALRGAMNRRSKASPLCVSAFLRLPGLEEDLPAQYMCWFRYLARLRNISLLCYGDGETVRAIGQIHPNVLEYKRRYGLPVKSAPKAKDAARLLHLSKPFILAHSREKFLHHTHYVWVDFGCLRYPVYERAALDWDNICRDKIVLAMVDGVPDASVLAVPDERLLTLCREIAALCDSAEELPEEKDLWLKLIHDHADWFYLADMPAPRELLTLTMTTREEEVHVYA